MATTRVWNISDDPTTKVPAIHIVVLGRDLAPGQFIQVDDARLKTAHKLKKEVARKWLWVGMEPPAHYRAFKGASAPVKPVRGAVHVQAPVTTAENAPKAVEATPGVPTEAPAVDAPLPPEDFEKSLEEGGKRKKKNWG